ncbi:translation initiation factor IF-2-like isoform X3 [Tyto alba]|uniref:translation initiation factor IF-2-like isoform X3 n=1 Tax=Tyto alba TaxID=56313 RepID=UPI001C66E812|nr:translation initiation factor IF-2-like isoform X3 [Tyto alba]
MLGVCLFTCSFPEEPHNVVWRGATHHPRDEAAGNGYEASHLNVGWESLGHPGEGDAALQLGSGSATAGDGTGVPDGRTFPAPRLDPAQESGWHPRETDAVAVQESAFPGGSSGSLPASASAREAMQAAEHAPAPWGHRLETGGYPLRPVSPTSHPGIPDSWDQHQQPQPPPETPARPPSMAPTAPGSPSPGPI